MKKYTAIKMAMSGLSVFVLLSLGCNSKPAAVKNVNVIPAPAPAVVEKNRNTEEIVKVIDVNGSNITYSLGNGKTEMVNASAFPSSLKAGDVVTLTNINGLVTLAKYRGLKVPIGC